LLDRGSVGVVNFDAHLDCRAVPDDGPTSGTPYRQLLDAGLDAYACVGARHFETSTAYHDYVRERGGEVVTAEEVGTDVVSAVDSALDALSDVDAVYVSVDMDVLDATFAPGVSAPTPGGLTSRELYRALRLVASDDRLAGIEVVETAPPLDEDDGRTVATAARAVAHLLAGWSA
jgi:formimidoylglutamase